MEVKFPWKDLLSSDDLIHFREWRRKHPNPSSSAFSFTTLEYYQFIHRSEGGPQCKHVRHPSVDEPRGYCAVCTIQASLDIIRLIVKRWKSLGGPWAGVGNMHRTPAYFRTQELWHKARLEVQKAVDTYEKQASEEKEWEQRNPDRAAYCKFTYSAAEGLRLFREGYQYPAKYSSDAPRPRKTEDRTKKTVRFEDDTSKQSPGDLTAV